MGENDRELSKLDQDRLQALKSALKAHAPKVEAQGGLLIILPEDTGLRNMDIIDCVIQNSEFKMLEASKVGNWIIIYGV